MTTLVQQFGPLLAWGDVEGGHYEVRGTPEASLVHVYIRVEDRFMEATSLLEDVLLPAVVAKLVAELTGGAS